MLLFPSRTLGQVLKGEFSPVAVNLHFLSILQSKKKVRKEPLNVNGMKMIMQIPSHAFMTLMNRPHRLCREEELNTAQ